MEGFLINYFFLLYFFFYKKGSRGYFKEDIAYWVSIVI